LTENGGGSLECPKPGKKKGELSRKCPGKISAREKCPDLLNRPTTSSAIPETARVTIRSMIG